MIRKMTPAEYHAIGRGKELREWAVSKSLLADFAASPYAWKLRHDVGEKREPTDSMEWGSALDARATDPACHLSPLHSDVARIAAIHVEEYEYRRYRREAERAS